MQIGYSIINSADQAKKASEFLIRDGNFGGMVSDNEEELIFSEPLASIEREHARFWIAINSNEEVIGVIGINENDVATGGYYLDWFAVDQEYRRAGVGSELLKLAEGFVIEMNGRYINIDTGDNEKYAKARAFYEHNGYQQVGHIPEFYHPKCGRIDYYKKFNS